MPKYKSLQVSVCTKSLVLSLSETLLSFMFQVRVVSVVAWCFQSVMMMELVQQQ